MILIPCVLLAAFPPGILFPQMAARMSSRGRVGSRFEKTEVTADDTTPQLQDPARGANENHTGQASGATTDAEPKDMA